MSYLCQTVSLALKFQHLKNNILAKKEPFPAILCLNFYFEEDMLGGPIPLCCVQQNTVYARMLTLYSFLCVLFDLGFFYSFVWVGIFCGSFFNITIRKLYKATSFRSCWLFLPFFHDCALLSALLWKDAWWESQ